MWTVLQMYKSLTPEQTLLPTDTGYEWWSEYESLPGAFDREFTRMFAGYKYDDIFGDSLITDWHLDIMALFTKNNKKYSEFYRIHTVTNEDMPLSYNYDMTEDMDKTTGDQGSVITGQRTDVSNNNYGDQNFSNANNVTGYNSNVEQRDNSGTSSSGSHNDILQFTKGREQDTSQNTGTEKYKLTRKGNIGVQTAADIARIFLNFWDDPKTNLYQVIFMDICRELLRIE